MSFVLRPPLAHELSSFSTCLDIAFGVKASPTERERFLRTLHEAAPIAAFDGDELIGTLTRQLVDLTLPGPVTERVAAISDIGVIPTHRRQGVMTSLMGQALREIRSEGSALAVLHARDGGLYRQFGFGPATYGTRYRMERTEAALRGDLGLPAKGTVQMMSTEEAMSCLPLIFADVATKRPGEIARPQPWWDELFEQFEEQSTPPRFFACYESDGSIDGYVIYDVTTDPTGDRSANETHIFELCADTPAAYRALYCFVIGLDTYGVVTTAERPTDEPLRQLISDPRALRITSVRDRSWIRLVDVRAALAARRYGGEGKVTLSVRDVDCPWNNETFTLHVDGDGIGSVGPKSGPVDVFCAVSDLAAGYLGAVNFSTLQASAAITEGESGGVHRADQLFSVRVAPFCSSAF